MIGEKSPSASSRGRKNKPFAIYESNLFPKKMCPKEKLFHQSLLFRSLSCVWLCNSMNCSTPDFPVLEYLPKFAQTHVHWIGDAIQPSHPLSPTSPPAFNLSQHQGLFQWVDNSRHILICVGDIAGKLGCERELPNQLPLAIWLHPRKETHTHTHTHTQTKQRSTGEVHSPGSQTHQRTKM